jgi:hypothetical protein
VIYFAVDEPRIALLNHYLARNSGQPICDCLRQVSYPDLFRTRTLARGAWIFTSLDALSDAELRMVHYLQTAARSAGLPVLNSAREALCRYRLLQLLHRAGLNSFQAHRADGPLAAVRFPVFVRLAGEHNGSLTPLLYNRAELLSAMGYLWMRGLPRRHLLVVEFCETAGADGLYRKYSIFRIGNTCVPRYLHIGPHWMTKSGTRHVEERLVLEEIAYLRENPHAAWASQVFEMAHIEYGRLDYGVREGRPQAWEINFTPFLAGNPGRPAGTPEDQRMRELTRAPKEYAHAALREAFQRIDPGPIPGAEVRAEFPPGLEDQARRERSAIQALERRQLWISKVTAVPGIRAVRPWVQRTLEGLYPRVR